MKALVWHAAGDLRFEEVAEPREPGPGEAVVAVAYCGICGTDLHEYAEGPVMIRPDPHPLTGHAPPVVLGHEFSGRIAALGPNVRGFEVGDRVTVDPCWRCGECFWCRRGDYHICRRGGSVGLASNGALAPLVLVPADGLVRLPHTVNDRNGALTEPLAVGQHAVNRGQVVTGTSVLLLGFGPVGAAVLLAARAVGADVYVSEPVAVRREKALELGGAEAFDPSTTDVRRETYLRTGKVGPDVVMECTGKPELVAAAVESARRGGRIVLVGIGRGHAEFDPRRVTLYERELVGSLGYNHDLPRVVSLMATGQIDPARLISDVVPLDHAVEGAFEPLLADPANHVKILLEVEGS